MPPVRNMAAKVLYHAKHCQEFWKLWMNAQFVFYPKLYSWRRRCIPSFLAQSFGSSSRSQKIYPRRINFLIYVRLILKALDELVPLLVRKEFLLNCSHIEGRRGHVLQWGERTLSHNQMATMDVVSTPCDKAVQISANASELRTTLPRRWKIFIDHTQNPSPKVDTGGKCRWELKLFRMCCSLWYILCTTLFKIKTTSYWSRPPIPSR